MKRDKNRAKGLKISSSGGKKSHAKIDNKALRRKSPEMKLRSIKYLIALQQHNR